MENKLSAEIFNGTLLGKDLKNVDNSFLTEVKLIGIYFSAHWCPPCRNFTPKLVKFYNEINKNKKIMEIIFASCDSDENQFNEYFNEMPWIAFPFGDQRNEALSDAYNCEGIPYLVILKPDGSVISMNGRQDVGAGSTAAVKKWYGIYKLFYKII